VNYKTYFRICLFIPLIVPLPFLLFKGDTGLSTLFIGSLVFGMPPYVLMVLLPFVFLFGKMTERQIVVGAMFLPVIYPFVYGLFWLIIPNFINTVSIKLTNHAEWIFLAVVIPASYSIMFLSGNIVRKLILGEIDTHERRLAAVLSADVKCYNQLIEGDEDDITHRLTESREELTQTIIKHRGRITNIAGDSIVAEFGSVIKAVRCAVEFQQQLKIKHDGLPPEECLQFRIGVNLGDVISKGEDIHGKGVLIAASIEGITDPGGISLSGSVYDRVKHKLSFSYDYLGEKSLENITEPVRIYKILLGEPETPDAHIPEPDIKPALPDKPSIAVLPFDNMSADPEQGYFSDGIAEDILTDLSKVSGLLVISRHSTFVYKGKSVSIQQVGKELGVRYVLEGSVRREGERLRITAQLIDALTEEHIWADRYDRKIDSIFEIQDEVSNKIVSALEVKLTGIEEKRLGYAGTNNVEAHDIKFRGEEQFYLFTLESINNAIELFSQAIKLDPSYAQAYAWKSKGLLYKFIISSYVSKDDVFELALALARKAVELDDLYPASHASLAWALMWSRQIDDAIIEAEKAVELDPNYAEGYLWQSRILSSAGRGTEALESIEKAIRLNPLYKAHYIFTFGVAYFTLGQYEEALHHIELALECNPNFLPSYFYKVSILGLLGRAEEAELAKADLLQRSPDYRATGFNMYNDEQLSRTFTEGLLKAGIEHRDL